MTARWSDPHRLQGPPACCDPGYVRAVNLARVKRVIARVNAILRPPVVTVTVRAGGTLSEIATAHALTLKALLAFAQNATYRKNPGLIHPGDFVRVK